MVKIYLVILFTFVGSHEMFNSVYVQQMYITLELGTEVYRVIQRTYTCEKDFSENEAKDKP